MKAKKFKQEELNQFQYGVYTWKDANGKIVADSDYRPMMIASKKGDPTKIEALRKAAEAWGIFGGEPYFESGVRPCTDDEYEDQKARLLAGETPDPYNLPELIDTMNYQKELNS